MKKKGIVIAAALLSLSGCANKVWDKYGATPQEFYQDRAECSAMSGPGNYQINTPQQTGYGNFNSGFQQGWNNAAAIGAASASGRIFNDCMMGRGWSLVSVSSPGKINMADVEPWPSKPRAAPKATPETKASTEEQINQAVSMLMEDPFEPLSPEDRFWRDLGRQVPDYREINGDKRFHRWLSVTDSTTGKERQAILIEAQSRNDADTVAAMFRQFLKTL